MTCHDVQLQLSLYLYGELDFAVEDAVEQHLTGCAFCQQAFSREKSWHFAASSGQKDISLETLAECRQDLRRSLAGGTAETARTRSSFLDFFRITPTRWSYQIAAASFLVFLGFAGARLIDRGGSLAGEGVTEAGFLDPSTSRIRDIQQNSAGQVRILLDQVNQREVIGQPGDARVKQWLMVAMQDPADPGIRVDSVEMLGRQAGPDVRDALLKRVQHDPNAAVRLKALEAVRGFSGDAVVRGVLRGVLEHDSDAAVRSEAIDVLVPVNQQRELSPDLAATLEMLARSENDDYVRGRCLQLLRVINAPDNVY